LNFFHYHDPGQLFGQSCGATSVKPWHFAVTLESLGLVPIKDSKYLRVLGARLRLVFRVEML
jgi:hypothetical protein